MKGKLSMLETNSKNKNIRYFHKGIINLQRDTNLKLTWQRMKRVTDLHIITKERRDEKNHSCQIGNVPFLQ